MAAISQSLKSLPIIFVHSKLDELGLTPDEFRIYCHLARRANEEAESWPGIMSISKICRISHNTTRKALKSLHAANLIIVIRSGGETNTYRLTDCSVWDASGLLRENTNGSALPLPDEGGVPTPTKVGRGVLPNLVGDPYQSREAKYIHEGNPIRTSTDLADGSVLKAQKEEGEQEVLALNGDQASRDTVTVQEVVNAWNSIEGVGKVRMVAGEREKHLRARLREPTWRANWREALDKMAKSDFCLGLVEPQPGRKRFEATFDWFIRGDSVAKLIEDRYANRTEPRREELPIVRAKPQRPRDQTPEDRQRTRELFRKTKELALAGC